MRQKGHKLIKNSEEHSIGLDSLNKQQQWSTLPSGK